MNARKWIPSLAVALNLFAGCLSPGIGQVNESYTNINLSQPNSNTGNQDSVTQTTHTVISASNNTAMEDGIVAEGDGWQVSKRTLRGGLQEGVELIQVDNGSMKFAVIVTRGMGIYKIESDELNLGWDSPVKQIVHPQFVDLNDNSGLGWLAGFNELVCRCGLAFAGGPGEDNGTMLTLHGRIANTPASEVEVVIDDEAPHTIRVRGLLEEKMFKFGNFELWTEVSTTPGSNSLRIDDRLVNRGAYDAEYQLIYHTNFGKPLLEEGAKFVGAVNEIFPMDNYAGKDLESFDTYLGPTPNYGEQVYNMRMRYDETGQTTVMLKNRDSSKGVALRYHVDSLPCFNLWKNTEPDVEGYVTGLEPATGFPFNRSIERANGRVLKLAPDTEKRFQLELTMLPNKESVADTQSTIEELRGDNETQVNSSPPNGPQEPSYVTVQHILIGFEGSVPGKEISRTKAEAEELANVILDRATQGAVFEDLVREFSDDDPVGIYQMANYGLPGDYDPPEVADKIFPRGGMVPAFGNVGFPLKLNDVGLADYDPETSKYGWHIIKRVK